MKNQKISDHPHSNSSQDQGKKSYPEHQTGCYLRFLNKFFIFGKLKFGLKSTLN